jgi:hypothetical protein
LGGAIRRRSWWFFSPSQFYLAVLEAIAVFFWNRESFC